MDDAMYRNRKNKRLNQLISKKFKNRHRNSNKKRHNHHRRKVPLGKTRKRKNNSSSLSLKTRYNEFQFQSSSIFVINEVTKPSTINNNSSHIRHEHEYDYYNINELIIHCSKNKPTHSAPNKPDTQRVQNDKVYKLYDDAYMSSPTKSRWIKLQNVGKFFKSCIYAFKDPTDTTHQDELWRREKAQNMRTITYFLQNVVEELYHCIVSDDIAHLIGEYVRGYLVSKCSNKSCAKYMRFFYEDRYLGVNTYFALSHNFETNDLIYCAECMQKVNMYKCDCGEMDFDHEFTKCLCYDYDINEEHTRMQIDEFKCDCGEHRLRCSRHPKCKGCKKTVCNECEFYGWGIDSGLCTKCALDESAMVKCGRCMHIFDRDERKISQCLLCETYVCNNVKWNQYPMPDEKAVLRRAYDKYLNHYECKCEWKSKYFDGTHNLWYPMYSEWQRRIELNTKPEDCESYMTLKCVYCEQFWPVCFSCDRSMETVLAAAVSPNKSATKNNSGKHIICQSCSEGYAKKCDLCDLQYLYYQGNTTKIVYPKARGDRHYFNDAQSVSINNMHTLRCIDCKQVCYICTQCELQQFKFYQCGSCKQTNRRQFCAYCDCLYYAHDLGDKVYTNDALSFTYFVQDISCVHCGYPVQNMCSNCHEENRNDLTCLDCLCGVCVQCQAKIDHETKQTLCQQCIETERDSWKMDNQFVSNKIDKKSKNKKRNKRRWKYKTEIERKAKKKGKIKQPGKCGKFVYRVNCHRPYEDCMEIEISSTWKKYKTPY